MKHLEFTGYALEGRGHALLRDSQLVSREPEPQGIFPSLRMFLFPLGLHGVAPADLGKHSSLPAAAIPGHLPAAQTNQPFPAPGPLHSLCSLGLESSSVCLDLRKCHCLQEAFSSYSKEALNCRLVSHHLAQGLDKPYPRHLYFLFLSPFLMQGPQDPCSPLPPCTWHTAAFRAAKSLALGTELTSKESAVDPAFSKG